jgi:hypothetical protein
MHLLALNRSEKGVRQSLARTSSFHQIILRALSQNLPPEGVVIILRQHDNRDIRMPLAHLVQCLKAPGIRKVESEKDDVHPSERETRKPTLQAVTAVNRKAAT